MTRKAADVARSTVRDVAARAGVSAPTVSHVLGGVWHWHWHWHWHWQGASGSETAGGSRSGFRGPT
ncbi:LacI family DNA-binding transcriptional regulator [Streptomyces sp. NBC_00016]